MSETPTAEEAQKWREEREAHQARRELLSAYVKDGKWLDAQEFPAPEYVVQGIIPEGLTILAGRPKCGKSWMVLDLALTTAAGGHAFGCIPTTPRPVMYLALEDGPRRLQLRARQLLGDGSAIPEWFHHCTRVPPDVVPALASAFVTAHAARQPLVIVDTLGKIQPPTNSGETDYQRDVRVGSKLKAIADDTPGAAICVVHHTRKATSGAGDFIDDLSGTLGIAGTADTILVLKRKRGEETGIICVTGRDVEENEYALDVRAGRWMLADASLEDAAYMVTQRKREMGLGETTLEIVNFVESRTFTTPADVADKFGIDPKQASNRLRQLYERGEIRKEKRGVYAPVRGTHAHNLTSEPP